MRRKSAWQRNRQVGGFGLDWTGKREMARLGQEKLLYLLLLYLAGSFGFLDLGRKEVSHKLDAFFAGFMTFNEKNILSPEITHSS